MEAFYLEDFVLVRPSGGREIRQEAVEHNRALGGLP